MSYEDHFLNVRRADLHSQQHAYIVTYELRALLHNYNNLYEELKRSTSWWHYMDRTWLVVRTEMLSEFSGKLLPLVSKNDSLLVMPVIGLAAGLLPQQAWDWIKTNISPY
jgi:hypothetical protein